MNLKKFPPFYSIDDIGNKPTSIYGVEKFYNRREMRSSKKIFPEMNLSSVKNPTLLS